MKKYVIFADDVETETEAIDLAKRLSNNLAAIKVGSILFTKYGPNIVKRMSEFAKIFLDLKYHDIPNTVENAIYQASMLGTSFLSLHTLGGRKMMKAAVNGVKRFQDETGKRGPFLIAVTVLTSLSASDIASDLNIPYQASDMAMLLTETAVKSGMDGIIASSHELKRLRKQIGNKLIITPGIRPRGASKFDQQRTATPREAIENGADYIVVGRPIYKSNNPEKVLENIVKETNIEDRSAEII
ncbi:MAG: orotidine-5'-phosphate decarboxylase [Epsilonproteobacteria bacterium]|nr:orotidine-5'-phosphate decarboxylase [Campylobacterota bacterium]